MKELGKIGGRGNGRSSDFTVYNRKICFGCVQSYVTNAASPICAWLRSDCHTTRENMSQSQDTGHLPIVHVAQNGLCITELHRVSES